LAESVEAVRIAVVSDIHGNLTAREAVIADLKHVGVDLSDYYIGRVGMSRAM